MTIDLFIDIPEINEIIVALPLDSMNQINNTNNKIRYTIGGCTRQDSVYKCLQLCNKDNKYVMIHDGVRPFFKKEDLYEMMNLVAIHNAVVPGSKVTNTLKQINENKIEKTIPRDNMVEVYTPQIFSLSMIQDFHNKAHEIRLDFTDDSSILEYFGETVHFYELSYKNIKITTFTDIKFMEALCTE